MMIFVFFLFFNRGSLFGVIKPKYDISCMIYDIGYRIFDMTVSQSGVPTNHPKLDHFHGNYLI